MACIVRFSDLSPEVYRKITSILEIKAVSTEGKYKKKQTQLIHFYQRQGEVMILPYMVAASIFQVIPNEEIGHPNISLKFTGKLRDYQVPIETEAWEQMQTFRTTTLGLYPGFGKTILGASLAVRTGYLTVVLVTMEILMNQWKKTFEDFTNARVWIVDHGPPPPAYEVIICMDTRWAKISRERRLEVGFVIIDEAHKFCTPTRVGALLAFNPRYILAESATLHREDELHSMIQAMVGTHGIFRESNQPFTIMKINTGISPVRNEETIDKYGNLKWIPFVRSILENRARNQMIMELIKSQPQAKTLILTLLKDHAYLLHQSCLEEGISVDYMCGNKKNYSDSQVLIGTTSKIGTGFDPATSCPTYEGRPFDLLILASSIKKYEMLVQYVGRVFRAEFPTVVYLVDDDYIFANHWNKSARWFLAHGGVIEEHYVGEKKMKSKNTSTSTTSTQLTWAQQKVAQLQNQKVVSVSSNQGNKK